MIAAAPDDAEVDEDVVGYAKGTVQNPPHAPDGVDFIPTWNWKFGDQEYSSTGASKTFTPRSLEQNGEIMLTLDTTNPDTLASSTRTFTADFTEDGYYEVEVIATVTYSYTKDDGTVVNVTSCPGSDYFGKPLSSGNSMASSSANSNYAGFSQSANSVPVNNSVN